MYFSQFPMMVYDLKGDKKFKLLPDILRRVKLRAGLSASRFVFDKYNVKENENPEDVAFKYYGDPTYHWVVLMVNNITDRYYQWPMNQADFADFLTDKYGAGNEDATHHHELAQTSGKTTSIDDSHMLEVNSDTDGATTITNRQFEERQQNKLRQIRLLEDKYLDAFTEEFFGLIKKNRF
jgi:hypothetical protein|tara:strand:+ start:457 stop:996 length:540 start_codon:yes stop_codon:yes gene_type:complete